MGLSVLAKNRSICIKARNGVEVCHIGLLKKREGDHDPQLLCEGGELGQKLVLLEIAGQRLEEMPLLVLLAKIMAKEKFGENDDVRALKRPRGAQAVEQIAREKLGCRMGMSWGAPTIWCTQGLEGMDGAGVVGEVIMRRSEDVKFRQLGKMSGSGRVQASA